VAVHQMIDRTAEVVSLHMLSLNRLTGWLHEMDLLRKAQAGIASC